MSLEAPNDESRALELERMTKCLHFSADVFTLVGETLAKSRTITAHAEIRMGEFDISQFEPVLKKHKLLCAEFRQKRLLKALGETVLDCQITTCGIWEFSHLVHHIIFDEDLAE